MEKIAMTETRGVVLYALSTCGWCKKTKALLASLGVEYECVDIDLFGGAERANALAALEQANPLKTLPTLVSANGDCIVGFKEEKIRSLFYA